jgi:Ca2+-binding RTX toxin-like protein
MCGNGDDKMPVFALYNFDESGSPVRDSALGNGAQDGVYLNGARAVGGRAQLDGCNDEIKINTDEAFQLDRGTLAIQFTQNAHVGSGPNTILSRDSVGQTDGGFHIDVLANGSIQIVHEAPGGGAYFCTPAGFLGACDEIKLSYSWDANGGGGRLVIENLTDRTTFDAPVPAGLTMDQGDINQPWIIGAGQSRSLPDIRNDIDQHFNGSVGFFSVSDTVDNGGGGARDGIVSGTDGDDLIDAAYTGDNDGDFVDRGDAILPGAAPNDDFIIAGAGNDTVRAGLGNDSVRGGDGNDELRGNEGNDSLAGGTGNDTLFGNDGNDLLRGQNGDDSLNGSNGQDTLFGGAGNDTLIGEDGSDLVQGDAGNDVIDTGGRSGLPLPDIGYPGLYPADPTPLNDLDTVFGGDGNDTIRTGDDADRIFGGTGNDNIDGGIDADTIFGGQGDDTIVGGEGSDSISAGTGNDLVFGGLGAGFPDSVNIPDDAGDLRPNNGIDTIDAGDGNDTIFGLDDTDLIFGGTGNDSIDGGVDNDTVIGGLGNDTITGGQGRDSLTGGADRDVFVGASGGDFIDGSESGDDFDTLDLTGSGPLRIVFADDNPENGTVTFLDADGNPTGTMNFVNIENVIPCFTPGTMIATPRGEVPVETLRAGDRIVTRDNGLQEIRWIGQKQLSWSDMAAAPHLRPVLVRQGSLGNALPERDMMVSPNHRLLVANDRTALYFDEHEVLVSAKHLVGSDGVHAVESMQTTYIHFMCDQHEVVLSNGAWTESFQPGDYTLKGMGNSQRAEIFELFPDLKSKEGLEGYTAARKTLKRHEARLLVR